VAGGASRGTHTARPTGAGCGAEKGGLSRRRRGSEELDIALGFGRVYGDGGGGNVGGEKVDCDGFEG
jgi:hypothetical protein